ncbi:MAG: 6-hydroxymethylpterin diphosphokinase MptE-like protein [Candidatus Altiarchaeota archaeon]|nr:6-hydroxymethylpterin diphosphokinase MptE-like protein [Candidatus Altiarchaeota archaeon]
MDWNQKYGEIVKGLGLDAEADLEAAEILDGLLVGSHPDFSRLDGLRGKKILVYGAGPSLREDIGEIMKQGLHRNKDFVFIAADGAAKALLKEDILPDIHVTDLDSDPEVILEVNRRGALTIVHAHGDNISSLKKVVPELRDCLGTTQTKPFGNLRNFGGFTDGDRCVFLAEYFKPSVIVLAGMDFGQLIGEYSGRYEKEFKLRKLSIGKQLLEELAEESPVEILNLTSGGMDILNIPRVSAQELKAFSSPRP